jgi:hypothetical protein
MGRGTRVRVLETTALGRKPATKRTYQQHPPFRTEGFIQLRGSWPVVRQAANDRPEKVDIQITRINSLAGVRHISLRNNDSSDDAASRCRSADEY